MGKIKKGGAKKLLGKVVSAGIGMVPGGGVAKTALKVAKGAGSLFGGKGKAGVSGKRRLSSPQKLARRLFEAKIRAKIKKAQMSPYKGL